MELNLTAEQYEKAAEAAWEAYAKADCSYKEKGILRDRIAAMVAAAPHLQAQPQQVSGSLVDRALSTWFGSFDGNLTPEQDQVRRMGNVLREFADELLKPILFHRQGNAAIEYINAHLESVRARLFSPPVDPEDRFRVVSKGSMGLQQWFVEDRGTGRSGPPFDAQKDAEIYRLGLIAQLRADATLKEKEQR